MSLLIHRGRYIQLRFASLPDGGIPIFCRPEDGSPVYVRDEYQGWLTPTSRTIIVPMFDTCPLPDLRPSEFRLWNEHVLSKIACRLVGEGVLTLSHRLGCGFHLGLTWSRHPLRPVSPYITGQPPRWWHAEGPVAETFSQLLRKVDGRLQGYAREWEQQETELRLNPPPPPTRAELARQGARVEVFRQRLAEALQGVR